MPFCSNCGEKLNEGVKFCSNCGMPVSEATKSSDSQRHQEYIGKIMKCPSCGETLKSFLTTCPLCGYELRGVKSSDSIHEFALKLGEAETEEQKISLVRSFPIPNTKEDIFEFMILASTNLDVNSYDSSIDNNTRKAVSSAWFAKFEQCYQKSVLLFKDDPDFLRIQKIYDEGCNSIRKVQKYRTNKNIAELILRNIAVCAGLIAVIVAVFVDKIGGNSSMIELVGCIVLIASASTLARRSATMIDFAIGAFSGIATICISFFLYNGSAAELCGGIVLIIIAVNFFKSVGQRKK